MRKAIIFIALGLILLGVAGWLLFPDLRTDILSGLFGGNSKKEVTFKYWGLWEPREVMQPLLDQYQKENPHVTIEYEERDPQEYAERIVNQLGVEGGPDIVRIHNTWLPSLYSKLAPLPDSVMTVDEYEAAFYGVNKVFGKKDNKYYAIPFMIDGLALVYNQQLFTDSGLSSAPTNWNEFRDYAKLLTKRNSQGEIVQAGAAIGSADNIDHFIDIVGLMFAQNGVKFVDESGTVTFHNTVTPLGSNRGAEALEYYTLFGTKEPVWNKDWGNSTDEFTKGKVAMVFLPSHRLHEIFSASPQFTVMVAQVPQLSVSSGQQQKITWANYWVESVSKTTASPEEAWRFLRWMSEKEQLTKMYAIAKNVRAFGEPYPRMDLSTALSADTYTLPYVQQGQYYTTWYFNDGVRNANLNDPIRSAINQMVNKVVAGGSLSTELNTAATTVQQVLNNSVKK